MAASILLAAAATAGQSADVALAVAESTNLVVSAGQPGQGIGVQLLYKTSDGIYIPIRSLGVGSLTEVKGPGTFAVKRLASPSSIGVYRD